MEKTLVIIPTYNEEENIGALIDALRALPFAPDVLVVDDGSDGTEQLVKEKQTSNPKIQIIKRTKKSGRGTAVLEGLRHGLREGYTYLVEMDADFSHNPQELLLLMEKATPAGVVIGSRYLKKSRIENWPLSRRIFSKCANFYAGLVLRIGIHDYTNGYRVYGKDAAQKIEFERIKSTGYIVLSELAYQLFCKGVSFTEVATVFVNRRRGTSNFSLKEVKEALLSVVRIRREYRL